VACGAVRRCAPTVASQDWSMAHSLITGATGGIGRAVCQRTPGHQLTLVARRPVFRMELCADRPEAQAFPTDDQSRVIQR
jgi:NADP-dependent 3-hydroxy acid dehydrogenase YdfG